MRIEGLPGEHAFKALYKWNGTWEVSQHYFLSYEEAEKWFSTYLEAEFKWPVEVQEGGIVYLPSKEELE